MSLWSKRAGALEAASSLDETVPLPRRSRCALSSSAGVRLSSRLLHEASLPSIDVGSERWTTMGGRLRRLDDFLERLDRVMRRLGRGTREEKRRTSQLVPEEIKARAVASIARACDVPLQRMRSMVVSVWLATDPEGRTGAVDGAIGIGRRAGRLVLRALRT